MGLPAIVLPLPVWTYDDEDPGLWRIPFFFWYRFLLVVVWVVLTLTAHRLVIGHERRRRLAEGRTNPWAASGSCR